MVCVCLTGGPCISWMPQADPVPVIADTATDNGDTSDSDRLIELVHGLVVLLGGRIEVSKACHWIAEHEPTLWRKWCRSGKVWCGFIMYGCG